MQAHYAEAFCRHNLLRPLTGFRFCASRPLPHFSSAAVSFSFNLSDRDRRPQVWKQRAGRYETVRAKKKDNVWSIDNELASKKAAEEKKGLKRRRKLRKKVKDSSRSGDSTVMVSGAMLTEVETVLQTQEPVIKPSWDIFASSLTGIWKGLGAVFSPFTAEMEPIGVGNQNENLFDCYTLSRIEKVPSQDSLSQIHRKTSRVALNPYGETRKHADLSNRATGSVKSSIAGKVNSDAGDMEFDLPCYESFDLEHSEISEEDSMSVEPGLVFFEDGSYSRGPVNIPVGEYDESKYFLCPTYGFEQCLVKGCHKRLRIVHTIEFNDGGANIQITRVAVYEEEWVSPVNISIGDSTPFDLRPISQRRRIQPSELAGSWKVFEVSATPVFSSVEASEEGDPSLVYLCMETLKKRSLPESSVYFGEEAELDSNDVTILWLPGGVATYVDVDKEGTLCIGISWYSDEGINLVMERDYGTDGNLKEVRWKSEIKRRWS
ncbi:uncharacterized protein LOC110038768 [Phalaenopsis equestris]|uniref:uncharacterized protein LOC110038768 n=1 Tax=Phalaenopsis equestris TaxID=78828 RepID=UPI0009E622B3|nr:uncharacterized protein LOC110038768 [Phalaenopsis equestris]